MYIRCSTSSQGFSFENNGLITPEDYDALIAEQGAFDEFGVVQCVSDEAGVGLDYNLSIDCTSGAPEDSSAFYVMRYDPETGFWDTDYNDYTPYTVDFSDPAYLEKMETFATNLLSEIINR